MKPAFRQIFRTLIIFVFVFPATSVFCGEPILSIDTGGHRSKINNVIFTRDNRYLVSSSNDKTIRVWDVQTGEIVRVIRGQIGQGFAGSIFTAALSPDNRWLAVAGYLATFTGNNHQEIGKIRLIDFRSGDIVGMLSGHSNVVLGLSFSSDSKKLISGSADDTARIWDVESKKMLLELKGHADSIYALAFSPDGTKAVSGSNDKTAKLWDTRTGRLISTLEGHSDSIKSVLFTRDNRYLLTGSEDHTIRMWNGSTGGFIKILATQDRGVDDLSISPDGLNLLTGCGPGPGSNENIVFSFPSGNKLRSFAKHGDIVLATGISPDNTLAATGDASGQDIYIWNFHTGEVKHRLSGKGNRVWNVGFARDGRSIAWGKTWGSRSLFEKGALKQSFILKTGRDYDLTMGPGLKDNTGYIRGIQSVGPWSVKTENNGIHKTLQILKNGNILHRITRSSVDGFNHRSLTLTPDGRKVISGGGNGTLCSYSVETGKRLHEFIGHTSDVWALACSPDSRLLVSGSADQTVKLWEIDTGKLLLTIFQGTDNEWVAWTPKGYYTASFRGDDYIGWHINQGADKPALYYPGSRFADKFYSPDITARYIATSGDIQTAIRQVNQEKPRTKQIQQTLIQDVARSLPPTVFIHTPRVRDMTVKENKVRVIAQAKSVTSDPVEDIWVLVNGRKLDKDAVQTAPKKQTGGLTAELDIWVPLMESDNRISIVASNRHGKSTPETFNVTWKSDSGFAGSSKDLFKPDLYLLSIGVSEYRDPQYNLDYADKDANGLARVLSSQQGKLYNTVHKKTLTNKDATKINILNALEWVYQSSTQKDLSVVFIAGHGLKDARNNYYFLPHDGNPDRLLVSGVKWSDFQDIISSLPSKVILMVDTCHSGSVTGKRRGAGDMTDALRELISADSGVVVMTASTGREFSNEHPDWGHGAFTKALIEGLSGKADYDGDRVIDIKEIDLYTTKRVKDLTDGSQHPTTEIPKTMPNFPFVTN